MDNPCPVMRNRWRLRCTEMKYEYFILSSTYFIVYVSVAVTACQTTQIRISSVVSSSGTALIYCTSSLSYI